MRIREIVAVRVGYGYKRIHVLLSLEDARDKIEAWRVDYNEYRPHSSLGYWTPSDYNRSGLFEAGKLTA